MKRNTKPMSVFTEVSTILVALLGREIKKKKGSTEIYLTKMVAFVWRLLLIT